MKKYLFPVLLTISANAFAQVEPVVTYEGGDLYFVPAKLTSKGIAFMYSYRNDWETGKTWFTIFDDNVQIVKQAEIEPEILNYQTRTITSHRRFFVKDGGTRAASSDEGYFLDDDWTVVSDVTENNTESNQWITSFEIYEDNNNYHSRYMYISQTLFNDDDDFEFLRNHYEIMPLSYCAADEPTLPGTITIERPTFGGEECDEFTRDYDYDLGGYVFTLKRYKVYGGTKVTGTDIISLDGTVKKTLEGITSFGTVVAINGNYYVTGYDYASSKYGLYKIATATTSLSRVANISSETKDNTTYNLSGMRVKANTKGIVIRNGQKVYNE